jgi:hypothetical protein
MPSSYTQNLGIEQPATGEQANTWGITANRNYTTLDMAARGNAQVTLSSSTFQLKIDPGADAPLGANALLIWSGQLSAQGSVVMDPDPGTRQHLYLMQNRTLGGFGVAFRQGSGSQFVLQNGYDALIYSDGLGAGSNVAAALANPQFANMLVTGALNVTGTVMGVLNVTGSIGIDAAQVPDPLTIAGLGTHSWGQLRLVGGGYGVLLHNNGTTFYLLLTAANDPYGAWAGSALFAADLASHAVGIGGWGPNPSFALSATTVHMAAATVDGAVVAGSVVSGNTLTVQSGGVNATGRSLFIDAEPYIIGLEYPGAALTYVGTNSASQFQVSNQGGASLFMVDQSGNASIVASLTVNGLIHSTSGGIQFPDGTVQTTAVVGLNVVPHSVGRTCGAVYPNPASTVMFVNAVTWENNSHALSALVGPGGNPTIKVAEGNTPNGMIQVFFLVPVGWSYQLVSTSGNIPTYLATEWY